MILSMWLQAPRGLAVVSTTTLLLILSSTTLSPSVVSAQQNAKLSISATCYTETIAIIQAGLVSVEYEKYIATGGCDGNTTFERCDLDYINSNSSDYEKACHDSRGTYYTYDYTSVCPADNEQNLTAYSRRTDAWYEPDCLGPSCTMQEAATIFEAQHPGCSVNTSFIETWAYGRASCFDDTIALNRDFSPLSKLRIQLTVNATGTSKLNGTGDDVFMTDDSISYTVDYRGTDLTEYHALCTNKGGTVRRHDVAVACSQSNNGVNKTEQTQVATPLCYAASCTGSLDEALAQYFHDEFPEGSIYLDDKGECTLTVVVASVGGTAADNNVASVMASAANPVGSFTTILWIMFTGMSSLWIG